MFTIFFLLLNCYCAFSTPFPALESYSSSTCGDGCQTVSADKINVHLVPHSHDDVGWLSTYDQYYVGTGHFASMSEAGVRYILDSTVQALNANANRRFIQVETAFFYKWWNEQNQTTRDVVIDLVNAGRLEMINGAWSMNDEAASNYHSIIDQFTWGFRILEDTVGACGRPKIGWQIDPFGHSREHASILKQLGFQGLVIGRLDYRDKLKRINDKNLDFIWTTNDNFEPAESQIFTTMFPSFYNYENGFCLEAYCGNIDSIDDSNLAEKVTLFKSYLNLYKDYYKTSNIMIPMGHDFSYQQAQLNFQYLDKLIEGFENDDTYSVIYSTPSCYIRAVQAEVVNKTIDLTVKTDDFFPYASGPHSFWTGYFTSRPTSKRFERLGNNILQSAKQLTTFSRIQGNDDDKYINKLRMIMGVLQHHDAITGTEKQAVADDYNFLLNQAIKEAEDPMNTIVTELLKKDASSTIDLKLSNCLRSNMSICDNSKKDRFVVAVQNPLSQTVSHYVRLPVDGANYQITGPEENITFDIFDTIHTFNFVDDGEPASKELVFLAKDLPPLGVKLYYVEKLDNASDAYHPFMNISDATTSFGNEINGFTIDTQGKLSSVTVNNVTLDMNQDFYYYKGSVDWTQESGAYVFRPNGTAILVTEQLPEVQYAQGSLVDEVRQVFSSEITQIITVHKGDGDNYVEFDWLVGNLQLDNEGKEVITKFTVADFNNEDIFYTDSNGRQQIKRMRNYRNDYTYDATEEPVSSNYYPVTSKIVIKDETKKLELAVLNDRSQGGSSLEDGTVELMVHRRDVKDDGFGVSEVLDEKEFGLGLYARGQHYLTFGKVEEGTQGPAVFERILAHRKLLSPVVLVGDATSEDLALDKVQEQFNFQFDGLTKSLPDNVQILTLEPWKDSFLLRLEHIFEKNEDAALSADATVDLTNLFTLFNITELTPMSLGANQNLETARSHLTGNLEGDFKSPKADPVLNVTLKAMEIKTFIIKTDKNNEGGHDTGIMEAVSGAQSLSFVVILLVLTSSLSVVF